ncbi:uncharacterized protein LOC116267184 [Nymphaea colorata]|nr:uncharacterized protein LOC116267184 [Nymphaea colorata]
MRKPRKGILLLPRSSSSRPPAGKSEPEESINVPSAALRLSLSPAREDAREVGLGGDEPRAVVPDAVPAAPAALLRAESLPARRREDVLPVEPRGLAAPSPLLRRPVSGAPLPRVVHQPLLRLAQEGRFVPPPPPRAPAAVGQYAHVDEHGEEEEGEEGEGRESGIPARCYFPLFVVCFVVLFSLFSLILWGASRSYKPVIAVKSMTFWRFNVQAGMDTSGVATQMLTINSTLKLSFTNRATFFGCHFTSSPLRLQYMDLRLASGDIEEFYQPRKSTRLISTVVEGIQVPLYGAGSSLSSEPTLDSPSVPLTLTFMTRSRAFILGKLVKTKFYIDIKCAMELNQKNTGKPVNLKGACSYT